MTDHIELLPLPKWMSNYAIPPDSDFFHKDVILADRMRDYARANVSSAIAPLQAEIERDEALLRQALYALETTARYQTCIPGAVDPAIKALRERLGEGAEP